VNNDLVDAEEGVEEYEEKSDTEEDEKHRHAEYK
jgi:hypothetical protein